MVHTMDFSVVIPVKDETDLIKQNLPSWCKLRPSEILLFFDWPCPQDCAEEAFRIGTEFRVPIKILEVAQNPAYRFHQAWVRRSGFRAAKYDTILTGDIDLLIYPACLKAIELVGQENVGLVSLSKLRRRQGFVGGLRNLMEHATRTYARVIRKRKAGLVFFTGLYVIDRKAWLDSEPLEGIKGLEDPKTAPLRLDSWGGYAGEDTFLRDWMIKKHRCLYLPDIGAVDTRLGLEDTRFIQLKIGRKFAHEKRSPLRVLLHTIIHVRPYVLVGYMDSVLRTLMGRS